VSDGRRGHQAGTGEYGEDGRDTCDAGDGGQRDSRERGTDRHRRLADRHRHATVARGEPRQYRAPARGVDARPGCARAQQQRTGRQGIPDERGGAQQHCGADESDGHDAALAEPVGRGAPGDEGGHETDRDDADQRSDTREVESEVVSQRRCDGGEAEEAGGGLHRRAYDQYHPAVVNPADRDTTLRPFPWSKKIV